MVRKYYNGSSVIEMAIVMPLVLGVWMFLIFTLFYYHDKAILNGVAYETAVIGSELWMDSEDEKREKVEQYFDERIKGKLLLFRWVETTIEMNEKWIRVKAQAIHKRFQVKVAEYCAITEPETEVRRNKVLKQGLEGESY